jgi:hypothetical protein
VNLAAARRVQVEGRSVLPSDARPWRQESMSSESRPCKRCGKEIPAERIEALPETELCVRCSEAVGSDFEVFVVAEKTSKAGSLKKNYGSYTIRKRRREIIPLDREPRE